MREVEAFEAKNTWGSLLDLVQQGEHVTIMRHGKPVARLVPAIVARDRSAAMAAVARVRERAQAREGSPVSIEEWARLRDDGRA